MVVVQLGGIQLDHSLLALGVSYRPSRLVYHLSYTLLYRLDANRWIAAGFAGANLAKDSDWASQTWVVAESSGTRAAPQFSYFT